MRPGLKSKFLNPFPFLCDTYMQKRNFLVVPKR